MAGKPGGAPAEAATSVPATTGEMGTRSGLVPSGAWLARTCTQQVALVEGMVRGSRATVRLTCGSSSPRGGRGPQSRHSSRPRSRVKVNNRWGTCSRGSIALSMAPPLWKPHLGPAHSPWGSRVAGTLGSHEQLAVARTPPAKGVARLQACLGATSHRSLPPPGLIPAG